MYGPSLLVVLYCEAQPKIQRGHLGLQDLNHIVRILWELIHLHLDNLLGTLDGDEDRHGADARASTSEEPRGATKLRTHPESFLDLGLPRVSNVEVRGRC